MYWKMIKANISTKLWAHNISSCFITYYILIMLNYNQEFIYHFFFFFFFLFLAFQFLYASLILVAASPLFFSVNYQRCLRFLSAYINAYSLLRYSSISWKCRFKLFSWSDSFFSYFCVLLRMVCSLTISESYAVMTSDNCCSLIILSPFDFISAFEFSSLILVSFVFSWAMRVFKLLSSF